MMWITYVKRFYLLMRKYLTKSVPSSTSQSDLRRTRDDREP